MTDDQMQSLRDDIAYMKALAQEGSQAPVLGGAILVASGLIFSAAAVIHWMAMVGWLPITGWGVAGIWGGAMAAFIIALSLISRRIRNKPGIRSAANRASRAVWSSVGWSIFVLAGVMMVISWRLHNGVVSMMFPSIILTLWGAGWAVQSAMANVRWMTGVAILAWISAIVVAYFAGQATIMLVYAVALLACGVVPGILMIRQEPSDIV